MTRSTAVLLGVLAIAAVLFAIVIASARRTHNAADFILGSRRLGIWLTALSYNANVTNAWMLLAVASAAFSWGRSAVWVWGAVLFGCIINGWYVAPRLRAASVAQGCLTPTQLLSADAGDRLQSFIVRSVVLILSLGLLLQMGGMMYAAGRLATTFLESNPANLIGVSVGIAASCVLIGGLRAACMLDAMQTILLLLVAAFLPLPALIATEGWEQLWAGLAAQGPQVTDWLGGRKGVVALAFAAGVFGIGLAAPGQPHAVLRYMAAKDEATVRAARWLALAWNAVALSVLLLCGWCARVLYAGLEEPEQALFAIASRLLSPSVAAIIAVALLAALILGIASQLLMIASSCAVDIKRVTAPVSLVIARFALAGAAIAAACIGIYASKGILDHALFTFTALGAAFGPLLLVRLSGKRVRPGATLGAMWSGFVLALLFHLLPDSPGDFLERVLPFIAALGIALTGGERRRNPDRADRSQQTVHDRVPI